jgi:hypothetical protein
VLNYEKGIGQIVTTLKGGYKMSRSYRKAWVKDGYKGSKGKQFFKRLANKLFRKMQDIPNGRAYRKCFDTWNICDYRYYVSSKSKCYKENLWKVNRK